MPTLEVFYGGAAGGGKSVALLAAALQYFDVPGHSALILRRNYQDLALPGALMDMAHEWLQGTGARWNAQDHRWTSPAGATISFGYLDSENDKYRYQSAQFQAISFDEVTQFTEGQYTYLFSRLRRLEGSTVPLRMRCASNPGGVGHEWVKARFVSGSNGAGRTYIPAVLEDNPGVDKIAYERALAQLDPVTQAQLRRGDWNIQPSGNLFRRGWFEIVDAPPAEVVGRCRGWDLAATEGAGDFMVGTKMSRTAAGVFYIEHVVRGQFGPAQAEAVVSQTTKSDGRYCRVRAEQEPAASGKIVAAWWTKLLAGYDVQFSPSSGDKVTRWRPFSAQAAAGNVKLVRGSWDLAGWLDRMERVPNAGVPDDEPDSASVAFNDLALSFIREPGHYGATF